MERYVIGGQVSKGNMHSTPLLSAKNHCMWYCGNDSVGEKKLHTKF